MCIAVLSTAHPKYALIVIDNRDEFILRATSRPHWWKPDCDGATVEVLSSRDRQRNEQGTWFGIARDGRLAVLTNYREDTADAVGERSRGRIVTAWLGAPARLSVDGFVHGMLASGETRGVGGFSLICGQLRKVHDGGGTRLAPLAILSNRNKDADKVPRICGATGETRGLSNTSFVDGGGAVPVEPVWPKIRDGERLMKEAIARAVEEDLPEEKLVELLFGILDHDTLKLEEGMTFDEFGIILKESIFIPPFRDEQGGKGMEAASKDGRTNGVPDLANTDRKHKSSAINEVMGMERPGPPPPNEPLSGLLSGLYGTQRQTLLLVDWDGQVTYMERALWSDSGEPIPRGSGDDIFRFQIQGWESS